MQAFRMQFRWTFRFKKGARLWRSTFAAGWKHRATATPNWPWPVALGLLRIYAIAAFCLLARSESDQTAAPSSIATAALQRLKGVDLDSNPALKNAVMKVVLSTKGTAQFVELVREFKITNQEPELLRFAIEHPKDAAGVDAARLLLSGQNENLIQTNLYSTGALNLVEVLGNAGKKEAVPLLLPLLQDSRTDLSLQKQTVHALAQTHEGAEELIRLATKSEGELRSWVGAELLNARWPEVKAAAAELRPTLQIQSLPPIPELVKLRGDPNRGIQVFNRDTVGCFKCHQIRGAGTDFGPNLTEIGTKLAKEAIYEAILDPSAGIAFGYEAWQLDLKNGDDAFGLLASETTDEIAIKTQGGFVTRYKKNEIARRTQLKTSIMPSGLAQLMSKQDLVDLVEFLASLKKDGQPVANSLAH